MQGSRIKSALQLSGYKIQEVATLMGLQQEELYAILSSANVAQNTVDDITRAIGKNIFIFEENYNQRSTIGNDNTFGGSANTAGGDVKNIGNDALASKLIKTIDDLTKGLAKKDEQIDELLSMLRRYINSDIEQKK